MYRKGIVLLLLLAVSASGAVFAQEEGSEAEAGGGSSGIKHWISGEATLLGVGARYEYMLNEKFSIGANFFFNSFFLIWNSVGVNVTGRYYFWKGLYGELGLGYGWLSGTSEYEYTYTAWNYWTGSYTVKETALGVHHINGIMIAPAIGYKIDFGDPGGFFICPMFSIPIVIGSKKYPYEFVSYAPPSKAGVGINIKAGIGLGGSF